MASHAAPWRVRFIAFALALFALLLVGRLYVLQVVRADEFLAEADHQYVRADLRLFDRGTIFFTEKKGEVTAAAGLKSGFAIILDPMKVMDAERLLVALEPFLPLEREVFLAQARKEDDRYEELARRAPEDLARRVEGLGFPELSVHREQWRFYPAASRAAQAIGFVAYDDSGTNLVGRYGLERFYEDVLRRDANSAHANFFAEIFTTIGAALREGDTALRGDIVTSVEPSVQLALERELQHIAERWGPRQSGGLILNPQNGEIYALALAPSFDLNYSGAQADPQVFRNDLVSGVYEMGSIMKPLTVAAGLDAGVISATTTYYDAGFLELDGRKISNFDGKGRGTVPLQEVLNQSLNTGAAFVASRLGNRRLAEYFRAYGLGEETGIDLPAEAHGLLDNLTSPRDIEYATASFGQGIAVTPIAMVRALAALGNGGRLVTPHLVTRIRYEGGLSKTISYRDEAQVISPEASEEISRMLVEVVDTALAGGAAKLPGYSIAAKTGTAQIANERGGGYDEERYLHSFFGYFPAYAPRFLVFFYTLEPQGASYASQTLTKPFMDTVQFLINYYDVPPDRS